MRYRPSDLFRLTGLALAYALLAKVALGFFSADGVVSIVWPSSGLALAALLIGGRKYWPGIFVGALAGNLLAGSSLGVSVPIAFGNTLEALACVWLLARSGRFDASLTHPRDFFLLALAGALSACIGALIGVTSLWLAGLLTDPSMAAQSLLLWWQGDTLGIVLLTPLLLVWRQPPQGWFERTRMVETIACFGLIFLAGQIIFLGWFHGVFGNSARGFWMFLLVTWAAVRFGRHGALLVLGLTAVQMLLGTVVQAEGFTRNLVPTGAINFWFYMLALSVTGISLALIIDRRKWAEATLHESKEQLQLAMDAARMGTFDWDVPRDHLTWSRSHEEMWGYKPGEFGGTYEAFLQRMHPEDRRGMNAAIARCLVTGETISREFRVVWPDKSVHWIYGRGEITLDGKGQPVRVRGAMVETTAQRQAEEGLRFSEERMRLVLDGVGPQMFVGLLDTEGVLLVANRPALEAAGLRLEDVLGKPVYDTYWLSYSEASRQRMQAAIQRAAKGEAVRYDEQIRVAEGQLAWVDLSVQPSRDATGKIVFLVPSAIVIDERKLAEVALRESEAILSATINTSLDAVVHMDSEGVITRWNTQAEKIFGWPPEEAIGRRLDDTIVPRRYREAHNRGMQHFMATGEGPILNSRVEISAQHRDGHEFPIELSITPLKVAGKYEFSAFVRDITERKRVEARVLRLTHLYQALSEVNMALVRLGEQAELFPLVCRCAVEFGGMSMAWIGQLDEASGLIVPVASYGNHLEYLDGIVVSSHADAPAGLGPTGTALRENRPIVINDYLADPATLPWRQRAIDCGWNSVATFPIQRGGQPFAALSVYHAQFNAFDEEAIALLEEMSKDIAFALDNFDRETERKAGEESLRLAASVYESSSEAIMVTDAGDRILAVNPAFTTITGYAAAEVLGKTPSFLSSDHQDKAFYRAMRQGINASGKWQGEIWDRRKNGEVYPKWLTINTVFDADGLVLRRIALFSDVSQKKESEILIWQQANFDVLTKLPNRQMFHDRLDQEIKKAYRAGLPLALLFLDLDGFKDVNDTLGHDKGDAMLKETALRLASCVRETDTVARLGGDEFTVTLGELDDISSVERVAQDILRKLAEPFQLGDDVAYVTASIGITLYPEDTTELDELIKNADQAMYAAKNQGRNRYHYFTAAMQQAAQHRRLLAVDLRGALAGNQFWIAYQPIVELTTGVIRKAEALIRWQHPTRGQVSPAEFVPLAEDTGLIVDIGDWVFREAARQVKHWRSKLHPEFQISVNKSPAQFHNVSQSHLVWLEHLQQLGLPGQSITVEITEGLLLDASALVTERLLEFRDAGMQVAIDDFGTGYSSLSYLKKFDIDYLKIDQSFVRNLAVDSNDLALCEAIIEMAHKLGLLVIAEGVETETQRTLLVEAGCDYAQGYLFSRPVTAAEFEKQYSSGSKRVQGQSA